MSFSVELSQRLLSTPRYAFAVVDEKVAELKGRGIKVIDFGVGDPSTPTPDFVMDGLTPAAHKHATSGYPSYIGLPSFREAAAAYLKRQYNVTLDPASEISSTIGSKEAIFHFPFAYINPGDVVIIPTPAYPVYATGTRYAGGECYFVPLREDKNFLIDFAAIPSEVAKRAKIIWTNYPNSPTGVTAPRTWLEELAAWARENNIIIAADEGCYIDIYFNQKPLSILNVAKTGVITFYSLSKRNNMTGYRTGFVAGDADVIAAFRKVKTQIDSGTPNFVQEASILALNDDLHEQKMREEYAAKRQILMPALEAAGLPPVRSDSTFYLWQKAPQGKDAMWLFQKFLDLGIVVTPGSLISAAPSDGSDNPGQDYVRFALVAPMADVRDAAERLQSASFRAAA